MQEPTPELATIFRQHGEGYRQTHSLSLEQLRVMRAIEICRTAALGGHVDRCSHCQQIRISYNSCRNRHCPKCQNLARAKWLDDRKADLLPVEYFHVVFTVPQQAAAIAFHNPEAVYSILFRAASETLLTIARDPKHLGAEIGFFAVLHTWGQNLLHHPHLHCVIPGGGLSLDQQRWNACRPGFFLPVRVLSRLFRRLFLEHLQRAFDQGQLRFSGELSSLACQPAWSAYLKPMQETQWVVYAKPPFGGPQQVIDYLGRYTHRVAISNQRLLAVNDQEVTFQWKDYRHKHKQKSRVMTLQAEEFIRRFLLHVLPPGFQRIRHFGFLANCHRNRKLMAILPLLSSPATELLPQRKHCQQALADIQAHLLPPVCPRCGIGILHPIQILAAYRWPAMPPENSS
jgi:Putative transposase/Transposase zinc-binding domain